MENENQNLAVESTSSPRPALESSLVVTRGGIPCPDQKAALGEFKQACLRSESNDLGLFNRREERIVTLIAALKRAKETIRQWNGMGLSDEAEKMEWDAYQHSPEMKQINAALESDV